MKRKMFGLDELTRMAGYTDTEIFTTREDLRGADNAYQDEVIGRLLKLQAQSANIERNIKAAQSPKSARTKTAGTSPAKRGQPRKCKDCKAKLGTDAEKQAGRCAGCITKAADAIRAEHDGTETQP